MLGPGVPPPTGTQECIARGSRKGVDLCLHLTAAAQTSPSLAVPGAEAKLLQHPEHPREGSGSRYNSQAISQLTFRLGRVLA